MSEIGDTFDALREGRRKKKESNHRRSIAILKERKFQIKQFDAFSYRVEGFNFWPTTGKYYHPKLKITGRGVFNLIKEIGKKGNDQHEK